MSSVTVYNGDIEQALRSLRKKIQRDGTFKKYKEKLFFANKVDIMRRKTLEQYKRRMRKKKMIEN